jgi:hypothetical protein
MDNSRREHIQVRLRLRQWQAGRKHSLGWPHLAARNGMPCPSSTQVTVGQARWQVVGAGQGTGQGCRAAPRRAGQQGA